MEIPIFLDGERAGTLTIVRRGGGAAAEARLRDAGRVVRLRVYGEREAWYLGIPVPEGGEMRLSRRLSRAQMRGFPATPLYAAEERLRGGEGREPAPEAPGRGRRVIWIGGRPHYF